MTTSARRLDRRIPRPGRSARGADRRRATRPFVGAYLRTPSTASRLELDEQWARLRQTLAGRDLVGHPAALREPTVEPQQLVQAGRAVGQERCIQHLEAVDQVQQRPEGVGAGLAVLLDLPPGRPLVEEPVPETGQR